MLQQLSQGSDEAFAVIFHKYRNRVYQVAMLYVKNAQLAEEVVQEVFLKLWLKRETLSEVEHFESWLFTVSKNHILNYLNKLAAEKAGKDSYELYSEASEDNTDHRLLQSNYNKLMEQAIESLSDQQKTVYRLAREEGLTHEAIGRKMSLSPLTVKTHMARALQAIRGYLQQHGDMFIILWIMQQAAFDTI